MSASLSAPFPSDEELAKAGWIKISRRLALITRAPRLAECYWIDFPHDAYEPEFVGEHPGVIIKPARNFHDVCVIVPLTTRDGDPSPYKYQLGKNPNPISRAKGEKSFAICNHLYTIHPHRLRYIKDRHDRPVYEKVDQSDLEEIFTRIRANLRHVFSAPAPEPLPPPAAPRPKGPNTLSLGSIKAKASPASDGKGDLD